MKKVIMKVLPVIEVGKKYDGVVTAVEKTAKGKIRITIRTEKGDLVREFDSTLYHNIGDYHLLSAKFPIFQNPIFKKNVAEIDLEQIVGQRVTVTACIYDNKYSWTY